MRVVINAQLDPDRSGGIAQVLLGLAHGLAQLQGNDDYVFICSPRSAEWLRPQVSGHLHIEVNHATKPAPRRGPRASDGFFESFDPDVIHFPYQSYTRTNVPTVFNPHDLQHVHLPQLFEQEEHERREALLGVGCYEADAIVVAGDWVRHDIVNHFGVDPTKVHVIEWGAPTSTYERPSDTDVSTVLNRFGLKPGFALYPAQTWPHKNHARLIDALARLQQQDGLVIPLICTGALTDHADCLVERAARLSAPKTISAEPQASACATDRNQAVSGDPELHATVRFLGRVSESDLMALYRAARMVVVPTLFEAVSFPIYEAFAEGIPVACSNVTSLPDQVDDAALLFDPRSVENMAHAIRHVWEDAELRRTLVARGRKRMEHFSWDRTAKAYSEIYRAVARQYVTTNAH